MTREASISVANLFARVLVATRNLGFPEASARQVATVIVDADAHGVHSHGVRLLASHAGQISSGSIVATAVPGLAVDNGVTGVVDGAGGYGPVVCTFALDHVVQAAGKYGMAAVAVRDSAHWGCPSFYARRAAGAGMVMFAASNTGRAMPLWGAAEASVGNNPIVFGIPRSDGEPWVLDISMQTAAWGKLAVYRDQGRPLPGQWGLDSDRRPTDDAGAIIDSGLIFPMGEHKGSGLAVIVEALTGGLAASIHSHEISERVATGARRSKSQFFLAIDPAAFGGRDGLQRLVSSFAQAVHGVPSSDPEHPLRLPGDGAATMFREYAANGIPLSPTLRKALAVLDRIEPG